MTRTNYRLSHSLQIDIIDKSSIFYIKDIFMTEELNFII
jgi:hypothetical protein